MITPPTDFFFVVHVQGEAAEAVAETISLGSMADIKEAVLISDDYENDFVAHMGMDVTIDGLKAGLFGDIEQLTTMNPLYIPSTRDEVDAVLEEAGNEDENLRFIGPDGSPFTMKTISVIGTDSLIMGKVQCKPFDMPSYKEIIAGLEVNIN